MQIASGSVFSALLLSLLAQSWGLQSDGPILLLSRICSQMIVTHLGWKLTTRTEQREPDFPTPTPILMLTLWFSVSVKGSDLDPRLCVGDKITVEFPFVLSGKNKSHWSVFLFRPLKRVQIRLVKFQCGQWLKLKLLWRRH